MPRSVMVETVSIDRGVAITSDGLEGRIVSFLDQYGDDTDVREEMTVVIVQWGEHAFSAIDLCDFEKPVLN